MADLPLISILAGLLIIAGVIIIPARFFQFFGGEVTRVETEDKVVALTLDDGPDPKYLTETLATLAQYHVKATFFLIGKEIDAHPAAAKQIVAAGHEVGNHSYSHRSLVFMPHGRLEAEIELTDAAIRRAGYKGAIPFRPPYGHKFISLPAYLKAHDRPTVLWSIAPDDDPVKNSAADLSARVERDVKPGSIIILHVMEDHRAESRKALDQFIPALQAKGYEFVTVSDLLTRR